MYYLLYVSIINILLQYNLIIFYIIYLNMLNSNNYFNEVYILYKQRMFTLLRFFNTKRSVNNVSNYLISTFNLITEPIVLISLWFLYVWISNVHNLTSFGIYTFFSDLHSGRHKHAYIYRYLCPWVLSVEFTKLISFLPYDFVFCTCAVIFLLWSVNERVISSGYSKSRLLSIYNLLYSINVFNIFKYFIVFHNCGSYNNHKFIYKKNIILCANYFFKI